MVSCVSATAERTFSLLQNSFKDQQYSSLVIEASDTTRSYDWWFVIFHCWL